MGLDLMKKPKIVIFIFAALFLSALSYVALKAKRAAAPPVVLVIDPVPAPAAPAAPAAAKK